MAELSKDRKSVAKPLEEQNAAQSIENAAGPTDDGANNEAGEAGGEEQVGNMKADTDVETIVKETIPKRPTKIRPQIKDAIITDRPKWKLSIKVEEDHAPRPRRRLNSTLLNGQWKGLTEAEKRAWMTQSDAADIQLAKLLLYHLKEKVDFLENPRYCRVPRVFKALKLFHVREIHGGVTELIPLDPPRIVFDGFEIGRVYTAAFQILNVSNWSQRLRALLPSTKTFQVHAESIQGEVLAPGKYCDLTVTFSPTSITDNTDALFISSEMDSCQIMLIGSNPLPTIFVPSAINLGYCLTGHSAALSFPIASLDAAAKFQLVSDSEPLSEKSRFYESIYSCQNFLYAPPFLAHPKSFNLGVNESTDVTAMFRPVCAGKVSQRIHISSEYGQKWNVLLEGYGTEIKVELERIDGRPFRPKEIESGLWFGNAALSTHNAKRELTVKNSTLLALRFYWKLESKGERKDTVENPGFSAQPCFGVLEPESEASFVFTFCPAEIKVYKQLAVLYLDTRQTFRLLSDSWEQFRSSLGNADKLAAQIISSEHGEEAILTCQADAASLQAATSICDQVFLTKEVDNNGSIVKALEVELIGVGDPFDVEIIPPLLSFSDMLVQGKTYVRPVEIRNNTLAEVNFSWKTPQIPWVIAKDLNSVSALPTNGRIGPLGNAMVNMTVRATKVGLLQETVVCVFSDPAGLSLPLLVEGCVQGPRVSIVQPMLDFGLVQIGTTVSLQLTLQNKSLVDASYKLLSVCEEAASIKSEEHSPEILFEENKSSTDSSEPEQELVFTPASGPVPPKEALNIRVDFVSKTRGQKAYAIICQVANGLPPTQYALARAFVDSPKAYFTPCKVDLGIIFLYKRLTRTATLHNLTGLPTYFKWPVCDDDNVGDTSSMKVDITPREGELDPYGSQEFLFRLTPIEVGEKELITICDIVGAETPIGVLFRTYISDFRCSYHILRPIEVVEADSSQKHHVENVKKLEPYPAIKILSKSLIDTTNMTSLDFGKRCRLGCVHWLRLVVQNHTDIASMIHVALNRYGTAHPPPLSKEEYVVLSALTGRPLTFSQAGSTKSVLKTKKRKVPPLIDLPDEVHQKYWSHSGHFMVSRRLEVEMHSILIKSGEAISLLVYPDCEGLIESWGQWYCDIFCFSCLPGSYSDILTCSVGGLPPSEIPISVGIIGTPLFARPQLLEPRGYQHPKNDSSLVLKWGPVSVGNPARTKRFWVANVSPYAMELKWEMKLPVENLRGQLSIVNLQAEDDSVVHVKLLGDPENGPVQVRLDVEDKAMVHFRVEENFVPPKDDYAFCVKPMKQVVPAHGNACFEVTFHAVQAAQFTCVLIGRTKIPDIPEEQEAGLMLKRPSRRVTFFESTEIIATDNLRRKSSVVTFSDPKTEGGLKSPEPFSELIKITSSIGSLPGRSSLRKASLSSEGTLLDARRSLRTSQGLLQDTRPERRSSLKKTSLQLTGQSLLRDAAGPERRSSLKKSSLLHTNETRKSLLPDGNQAEPSESEAPASGTPDDGNPPGMVGYDPHEDPITPLRVCLEALVFEPRLKPSIDDTIEFYCCGVTPLSDKSYTNLLILKNEYSHSLTFSATIQPPFYILAVESGLLSSENEGNTLQTADPHSLSNFMLPSEWSLRLTINFRPEDEIMAQYQDVVFDRELVLKFFEQYTQAISLQAKVQFPAVRVLSENIWFGTVLTTATQTLPFSVINASYFNTEWRLVKDELKEEEPPPVEEIPPPGAKKNKKASIAPVKKASVIAAAVEEQAPSATPPAEVVVRDPFKVDVEGGLLPGRGTREATKQVVTVTFTPPEAKIYKQVFRIEAGNGRGCSLVMEGQGILEKPPEAVAEAPPDPKGAKKGKK